MEVTITQFRRQIFQLVNQAMEGTEVWVTHKGRRFKITPDTKPAHKLDRLTPTDCINFDVPDPEKTGSLLKEMTEPGKKTGKNLIAYLDTNAAVRLMQGDRKPMSREAQSLMNRCELLISPMASLELELLYEIKRIKFHSNSILNKLQSEIGLTVCNLPFDQITQMALNESWTRDPFDRIIVAQARANGLAWLISTDEHIAKHYPRTVW